MRNPFRQRTEAEVTGLDEAEALKGKYRLENWRSSAEGRFDTEIVLDGGKASPADNGTVTGSNNGTVGIPGSLRTQDPGSTEDSLDTMVRELSVLSQGMGGQKTNYPITPENRIAISEAVAVTRWARDNLNPSNLLRKYLESEIKILNTEIFDRSIGTIEPAVVYGVKPWVSPGVPPGALPSGQTQAGMEQTKKAP